MTAHKNRLVSGLAEGVQKLKNAAALQLTVTVLADIQLNSLARIMYYKTCS